MAFQPISRVPIQYQDSNGKPYSGAVLKFYSAGTSTPISISSNNTGLPALSTIQLGSLGYPEVSGSIIIPYIDQAYKLVLYPNQDAADTNTGAILSHDNLSLGLSFGERTIEINANTVLTQEQHANAQLYVTGTVTLTLPPIENVSNAFIATIYNAGTGVVTLDPDTTETINGTSLATIGAGGGGILVAGDLGSTSSWVFNSVPAVLNEDNFGSNSSTQAPSQRSTAQYIASQIASQSIPVGFPIMWPNPECPVWALERDGAEVSRTTYSALFNVITFDEDGGATTDTSTTVTMSSTAILGEGMTIEGDGIPALTTIVSVDSATSVTISQPATATGTSLTFKIFPYGGGDGSATFNMPDDRGLVERGWDNGRGFDTDRVFGSYQSDAIKEHNHSGSVNINHAHSVNADTGSGNGAQSFETGEFVVTTVSTNSAGGTKSFTTNNTGIIENRVKNRAYLPIIKY